MICGTRETAKYLCDYYQEPVVLHFVIKQNVSQEVGALELGLWSSSEACAQIHRNRSGANLKAGSGFKQEGMDPLRAGLASITKCVIL